MPHYPNVIVAAFLVLTALAVVVYDTWALAYRNETWTITYVLRGWSSDFPILPLIIGILLGHIFFCSYTKPPPSWQPDGGREGQPQVLDPTKPRVGDKLNPH